MITDGCVKDWMDNVDNALINHGQVDLMNYDVPNVTTNWDKRRRDVITDSTHSALKSQIGGNHYSKLKIQPVEYIHGNNIPFIEGSCIKYLTRWRDKGGVRDLEKVKHFIDLLIEMEGK
jgi:hypothetical protein